MDRQTIRQHLEAAISAARLAGKEALAREKKRDFTVSSKATNDYVTDADKGNEKLITEYLRERFPEESFLGEETGEHDSTGKGRWIIDPIDGTTNFFRGVPNWVISIAWETELHHPLVGVVFCPSQNEMFTASEGEGAFLNGKPIHVSDVDDPKKALIVLVPPHRRHEGAEPYFEVEKKFFYSCSDIRSFGSCALELCYIAAGRLDIYMEQFLCYWDLAAGTVILREAGGIIECLEGFQDRRCDLVATNGKLQRWTMEVIGDGLVRT